MNEKPDASSDKDAELEREIRADRKFSVSEAIGRMAGPGMMKGVSPVTPQRQAELEIGEYLQHNLKDTGGVLASVLLRDVGQSDLLLGNYGQPLAVLSLHLKRIIESEHLLKNLVREADVEWGQVFGERPHFNRPGSQTDPDDPYTVESVRATLSHLIDKLAT